jgi:hypothetical protein
MSSYRMELRYVSVQRWGKSKLIHTENRIREATNVEFEK